MTLELTLLRSTLAVMVCSDAARGVVTTDGSLGAGDVFAGAQTVFLQNSARVGSQSADKGRGGSVQFEGDRLYLNQGARITASSDHSAAGNVLVE